MQRPTCTALLVAALAALPALAAAQRRAAMEAGPEHELGADLAFQYASFGRGGGSGVQLFAPVDVRIGFLSKSRMMFETRASLSWDSNVGALDFAPGVNVLYQLKKGTGTRGLMHAPYATGGVGLDVVHVRGLGSQAQFGLNGGVGTRLAYGSAVVRPEAYLGYAFSSGFLPSVFSIGTRIGLSFWH